MYSKNSHTSSLVHYTKSQARLLSILKQGFGFSYCKEEFLYKHKQIYVGIPMLSFCDIPISRSLEHSQKYGKYAIGLSKESLFECDEIRKVLSPVHYFISEEQTKPVLQLMEQTKELKDEYIKSTSEDKHSLVLSLVEGNYRQNAQYSIGEVNDWAHHYMRTQYNISAVCHSMGMLKPYTSLRKRTKSSKPRLQINYDECEWRVIIPEIWNVYGESFSWLWSEEEYNLWRGNKRKKPFVNENAGITFTSDCISFIILKEEKEVPIFIDKLNKLQSLCDKSLSSDELKILCSKVISFERIRSDF